MLSFVGKRILHTHVVFKLLKIITAEQPNSYANLKNRELQPGPLRMALFNTIRHYKLSPTTLRLTLLSIFLFPKPHSLCSERQHTVLPPPHSCSPFRSGPVIPAFSSTPHWLSFPAGTGFAVAILMLPSEHS